MLLCKFSSGHVESIFDNIAKNFPVKTQVFLSKSRKDEKPFVQQWFFRRFSSVHLDCCFDKSDYFFLPKSEKNSLKVLKKMSLV